MLSENLSEAIRSEFFTLLNTYEPNITLKELLRQEIAEYAGLMQKNDPGCVDDDGNVYRDEVARHQAEMEAEKRKQARDLMIERSSAGENDVESKMRSLAFMLISAGGDWLNLDEE